MIKPRGLRSFSEVCAVYSPPSVEPLNLLGLREAGPMPDRATILIAACIVVPQLVVAACSPWVGRQAKALGRKKMLLIGFTASLSGFLTNASTINTSRRFSDTFRHKKGRVRNKNGPLSQCCHKRPAIFLQLWIFIHVTVQRIAHTTVRARRSHTGTAIRAGALPLVWPLPDAVLLQNPCERLSQPLQANLWRCAFPMRSVR
jgi:hypothetical protein